MCRGKITASVIFRGEGARMGFTGVNVGLVGGESGISGCVA